MHRDAAALQRVYFAAAGRHNGTNIYFQSHSNLIHEMFELKRQKETSYEILCLVFGFSHQPIQ